MLSALTLAELTLCLRCGTRSGPFGNRGKCTLSPFSKGHNLLSAQTLAQLSWWLHCGMHSGPFGNRGKCTLSPFSKGHNLLSAQTLAQLSWWLHCGMHSGPFGNRGNKNISFGMRYSRCCTARWTNIWCSRHTCNWGGGLGGLPPSRIRNSKEGGQKFEKIFEK